MLSSEIVLSDRRQVIQQVKKRRLDALRAQEHGNLCRVSHLVKCFGAPRDPARG